MRVQIQNHLNIILFNSFSYVVDHRLVYFMRVSPFSVGVAPAKLGPAVAVHYPVYVYHRHYFYDEIVEQILSLDVVRQQKLNNPFCHEAGSHLPWMLPPKDPNGFLGSP